MSLLLLSLRGSVTIKYDGELSLWLRVLFVKIKILPSQKKGKKIHSMSKKKSEKIKNDLKKRAEKKRLKAEEKRARKDEKKKNKKKKTAQELLDDVSDIAGLVKIILSKFFKRIRVKVARFNITVATGDAATTAIAYGAICQAVSYTIALLESSRNVSGLSHSHIDIRTDFCAEAPSADIKISFSLRVWNLLEIGIAALVRFIKNKLRRDANKEKAQTQNESNKNSKINHKF